MEKPRPEPALEPVFRDDVRVEGAPVRCPFCHTDVDVEGAWSACGRCLARHHDGCWQEGARCSGCGHDVAVHHAARMAPPAPSGRSKPSVRRTLGALVLSLAVALLVVLGVTPSRRVAQAPSAPAPAPREEELARPPAGRAVRHGALEVHDGRGNFALVFEDEGTLMFGLGVELRGLTPERVDVYQGSGHTSTQWRAARARAARQTGRPVTVVTRSNHREGLFLRVPRTEAIEVLRTTPLEGLDLEELYRRLAAP